MLRRSEVSRAEQSRQVDDEEGDKNKNAGGELVEGGGVERAMARTRY